MQYSAACMSHTQTAPHTRAPSTWHLEGCPALCARGVCVCGICMQEGRCALEALKDAAALVHCCPHALVVQGPGGPQARSIHRHRHQPTTCRQRGCVVHTTRHTPPTPSSTAPPAASPRRRVQSPIAVRLFASCEVSASTVQAALRTIIPQHRASGYTNSRLASLAPSCAPTLLLLQSLFL